MSVNSKNFHSDMKKMIIWLSSCRISQVLVQVLPLLKDDTRSLPPSKILN